MNITRGSVEYQPTASVDPVDESDRLPAGAAR
jgi:hypothetical protein